MPKVTGYGIVPLRRLDNNWYVFVIRRTKGFWELPKGHSEPGESPLETAKRELLEETGLQVSQLISEKPFTIQYEYEEEGRDITKEVLYFLAEVRGEVALQPEEVNEGQWIHIDQADKLLTFENSMALIQEVNEKLKKF